MGRDIRGVARGACSLCPCKDFTATNDGTAKCANCGHVPAQHTNRDQAPGVTTPSVVVPAARVSSASSLSSSSASSLSSPSIAVAKPMVTVAANVCTFPGCQQLPLFDPNTGEESGFCSDHMDSNGEPLLPQCSLPRCTRPRNFDHVNRFLYDYCSRKHGKEHILQFCQPSPDSEVIPPHLKCKNPKCYRKRYQEKDGTLYDYCGITCRNFASQAPPGPGSGAGPVCALPGCYLPAQKDHPFCGKSHARVLLEVDQTSTEYKQVLKTFQGKWVKNPPAPAADCIFKIFVPQVEAQFKQYQSSLANQTVESHFHGTTMKCDLLSTKKPCKTKNCGICEISRHGFDLKKIGTNISFMRFGRGFYLAPNSSKCHDYTQGVTTHRSMLLCDVLPGKKHIVKQDQTSLNSPPQGYDSVYGKSGGSLNYDEIVLYHPPALLPKYVIVYQKDGIAKIAK